MILIFISIFLTGRLTFCNSVLLNYNSATHFTVLAKLNPMYFTGLWVHELSYEIVEKQQNLCEMLHNPIIIPDITINTFTNTNRTHRKFVTNRGVIPKLNTSDNGESEPFMVEDPDQNVKMHLLPCDRILSETEVQRIYISKVRKYNTLIMLVNGGMPQSDVRYLRILGFLVEFINITLIHRNNWKLFQNVFGHLEIYRERLQGDIINFQPIYLSPDNLTVENRVLLLKLCASVLRASPQKIMVPSPYSHLNAAYVQKDFSFIWNIPSSSERIPSLILNAIHCDYAKLTYYLINKESDIYNLFVIYVINNVGNLELFKVPPENIYLIEFAFSYIRDEVL